MYFKNKTKTENSNSIYAIIFCFIDSFKKMFYCAVEWIAVLIH